MNNMNNKSNNEFISKQFLNSTKESSFDFYIGLSLAILSTVFIGTSFIFKKLALRRASRNGTRAGDGSLSYLCEWMWWIGFILMGIGEFANFVAYTFAPAVLVTPLGALSVLVSAILSSRCLNEHLNFMGSMGCFICLLGSTLVILHAPREQNLTSLHEMWIRCVDPPFITYCICIMILSSIFIFVIGPRCGKTNPLVFTMISGSIGSLSVIACKGVGVGIKDALSQNIQMTIKFWFFWFLILWLISALSIQMYYLNKALDLFNTGLVTPILYVQFTGFVLIASAILFHEWNSLQLFDYLGLITGLILCVFGIFMMTVFKHFTGCRFLITETNLNCDLLRNYLRKNSDYKFLNHIVYKQKRFTNRHFGHSRTKSLDDYQYFYNHHKNVNNNESELDKENLLNSQETINHNVQFYNSNPNSITPYFSSQNLAKTHFTGCLEV